MDISAALEEFHQKFKTPLMADITRTLEVTCYKSGTENHGSNFVGNAVVLMGIEATAQFINPASKEEMNRFKKEAKEQFDKLCEEQKKYLMQSYSEKTGSELAQEFMKKYFDSRFSKKVKEFGVPLYELIWAFRNPHMHSFYPYYQKNINGRLISGGVDWGYNEEGEGIEIEKIESKFDSYKRFLYRIEGSCFRICPQILFVFFKRAVEEYVERIRRNNELQKQFRGNYKRLAGNYRFRL